MRNTKKLKSETNNSVYNKLMCANLGCPICPPNRGCNRKSRRLRNWKAYRKQQWVEK